MEEQTGTDMIFEEQEKNSETQEIILGDPEGNLPEESNLDPEVQGNAPEINKIQSFIIPPKMGINYKPGIWHFPLISTENMDFLVLDRKGNGNNLIIHNFEKEKIILEY